MSLYNMLFGTNPFSDVLLAMLGLTRNDCGRFRDCYPSEDGTKIILHTRNGGGNREAYQDVIDELAKHPCYLSDNDDDFDCTYADIVFRVPDGCQDAVAKMADSTDTTPPGEKWHKLLDDMRAGKDNQVVARATSVGKQIFGAILSDAKEDQLIKTTEGSVVVMKPDTKEAA